MDGGVFFWNLWKSAKGHIPCICCSEALLSKANIQRRHHGNGFITTSGIIHQRWHYPQIHSKMKNTSLIFHMTFSYLQFSCRHSNKKVCISYFLAIFTFYLIFMSFIPVNVVCVLQVYVLLRFSINYEISSFVSWHLVEFECQCGGFNGKLWSGAGCILRTECQKDLHSM